MISRNALFRRRQFRQSFSCNDIDSLISFSAHIRLLVEYNSVIWSPHFLCGINNNTSYLGRLEYLKIESLELRRVKADLIFVYEIINNLVDFIYIDFFSFNTRVTRGRNYKINIQYSRVNTRKYFFCKPSSTNMDFSI